VSLVQTCYELVLQCKGLSDPGNVGLGGFAVVAMLHQEDDAEHEHATPHVDYQYGFDMVFCRRAIRILRISLPALWSWDGFWLAVFVFMVRPSRPHGNRLLDYVFEPFPTALRELRHVPCVHSSNKHCLRQVFPPLFTQLLFNLMPGTLRPHLRPPHLPFAAASPLRHAESAPARAL
jgi:hypothetical protein